MIGHDFGKARMERFISRFTGDVRLTIERLNIGRET
jgi:hypothetical protein